MHGSRTLGAVTLLVVGALAVTVPTGPVSPLVLALIAGVVAAHLPGRRLAVEGLGRDALRAGIVLLGLRLSVDALWDIGLSGLVIVVVTVIATYAATRAVGRRLGLDDDLVTLIAVGFSICGAAAIAGVQDIVRARSGAVAQAVAMVTIFGSAMILVLPLTARMLRLDAQQAAVWAGASIHEVAHVVAASAVAAPAAVGVAVTVKLARVVLLAPMSLAVGGTGADRTDAPRVPWFVIGFLIAVGLRSSVALPADALTLADRLSTGLLAAGMFALGTGVHLRALTQGTARLFALAAMSTAVAGGVSLLLVLGLR